MKSARSRIGQRSAAVAAALLLLGCSETPTEPSAATPPQPGRWSLTSQVTAASGSLCAPLPDVGRVGQTTFQLQRFGDVVAFSMDDRVGWVSYSALANGPSFAATSTRSMPLQDSQCLAYDAINDEGWTWRFSLSGTFSDDFSRFSATEVWTFTDSYTGESVTRAFSWSATRL